MKIILTILIASALILSGCSVVKKAKNENNFSSVQKDLTKSEVIEISSGVRSFINYTNTGNHKMLYKNTHPSVIKDLGGKEIFDDIITGRRLMREAWHNEETMDIVKIGEPIKLYLVGEEEICFVPTEIIKTCKNNEKSKNIGYIVSVRKIGENNWSYINCNDINKPNKLWRLFPHLGKGINIPPVTYEKIK